MGVLKVWNGTEWVESAGATGDVNGPSSSTDNALARWDGTTGKLIQDSSVILADNGGMTEVRSVTGEVGTNLTIKAANGSSGVEMAINGGNRTGIGTGGGASIVGGGGGDTSGDGGPASVTGGAPVTSGNGGPANLSGADGFGTDKDGGDANLNAGQPTGSGTAGVIHCKRDFALSNRDEGGTGRLVRRTSHETHTLAAASTSDTTTISIPSGARLLGVSFNVNTEIANGDISDRWNVDFITGSTTQIAVNRAKTVNTKVDFIVPDDEKTSAVTEIRFTAVAGSFSAGVIEVVAYYEDLVSLADV